MDLEDIYQNVERRDIVDTTGPQTLNHRQNEGKDQKHRGSRCLVLMTVCLGIICVLLLIFIIVQHIFITAERESLFKSYKNTVEEFNQTINNYTDLAQKKLELESKVRSLSDELKKAASKRIFFPTSSESKSWSDSRQYCRDRGADLVIIDTEEKQRLISSFIKERVWIGLTDIENEGRMKWVDNSLLKRGFNTIVKTLLIILRTTPHIVKTYCQTQLIMDLEDIYQNVERRDIEDTTGPQTLNHRQNEGKDQKHRGSRCLVLMTVCLGIICVLLLIFIIVQHIFITAERESLFKSYKNTVEEFNQTISRLQHNYTELMTEKDQLKNNFSSLSQKNLELETRVNGLTAEKKQLQRNIDSLSQKKLELETRVTSLSQKLDTKAFKEGCLCRLDGLFISNDKMSWSDSRKYCRDRGGDLVIIKSEKKQRLISSFIKERVWIGLTDIEKEGKMKWLDNSPLRQGFWMEGEPNDANGKEDCVEMKSSCTSSELKNWNDLPCSEKRKVVCEK
ncbi:uncharacterized protein [Chanodichthys erythropterus]|uniref:uncharacterized protein n=1 Tax=Chanodichthys erythropterus TaxID=933992 RepID=UPI00351E973B